MGGVCEWGLGMLREREEEGTVRRRCQFCWGCDTSDYAKGRRFGGFKGLVCWAKVPSEGAGRLWWRVRVENKLEGVLFI